MNLPWSRPSRVLPSDTAFPCMECGIVHPLRVLEPMHTLVRRKVGREHAMLSIFTGAIVQCASTGVTFEIRPEGPVRLKAPGRKAEAQRPAPDELLEPRVPPPPPREAPPW